MTYDNSEHAQKDGTTVPTSCEKAGTFKDRVACLIELAGNGSALARMADVSESVVRKWRDGASEPSLSKLIALTEATGVRLEWLATGQGPMRPVAPSGFGDRVEDSAFESHVLWGDEVEVSADLDDIEKYLNTLERVPVTEHDIKKDQRLDAAHKRLKEVVSMKLGGFLPQRARTLLRLAFPDQPDRAPTNQVKEAYQRLQQASTVLAIAIDALDWTPPPALAEAIKTTIYENQLPPGDIVRLLSAFRDECTRE